VAEQDGRIVNLRGAVEQQTDTSMRQLKLAERYSLSSNRLLGSVWKLQIFSAPNYPIIIRVEAERVFWDTSSSHARLFCENPTQLLHFVSSKPCQAHNNQALLNYSVNIIQLIIVIMVLACSVSLLNRLSVTAAYQFERTRVYAPTVVR
jgi:hypothetical protein